MIEDFGYWWDFENGKEPSSEHKISSFDGLMSHTSTNWWLLSIETKENRGFVACSIGSRCS
jgi:hypothetical protein